MKVAVTAGGTGGHIYPALAIIKELEKRGVKKSNILYIGTTDRMEKDIVPKAGYNFKALEVEGLDRKNIIRNIEVFRKYNKACNLSKKILDDFKADIVIGVGGYITLPVVRTAQKLGIPTVIHEQNIIPGLANRLLSNKTEYNFYSLKGTEKYFKKRGVYSGNPVADAVLSAKEYDRKKLFDNNKKIILIVMGSLGSVTINKALKDMVNKLDDKYNYIIVTGKDYYEDFPKSNKVKIVPYIDNMKEVLKSIDLIVSRSGASILAEITAVGLPAILVPSPYVTHNHQYLNAKALEDEGAAVILSEMEFNADKLNALINDVLSNEDRLSKMKKKSLKLAKTDAAKIIVDHIYEIVGRKVSE